MAKKLTKQQKIDLAKEELSEIPFELKRLSKQTFYENKSLGGSCSIYETFEEYYAEEVMGL